MYKKCIHHCLWATWLCLQATVLLMSCCPWCWKPGRCRTAPTKSKRCHFCVIMKFFGVYFQMAHSLKSRLNILFVLNVPLHIAANVWVSKNCVMTRGAEERMRRGWGEEGEEGGRVGNIAVSAATLRLRGSRQQQEAAAVVRQPEGAAYLQLGEPISERTGGNLTFNRDDF